MIEPLQSAQEPQIYDSYLLIKLVLDAKHCAVSRFKQLGEAKKRIKRVPRVMATIGTVTWQ